MDGLDLGFKPEDQSVGIIEGFETNGVLDEKWLLLHGNNVLLAVIEAKKRRLPRTNAAIERGIREGAHKKCGD